jgi:thiamine kinase-like enzyme
MTSELFGHYEHIKSIYPRNDSDMVACHNDLKPENVLFDGEQVWLVDWEAAFLNDRYLDLAVVANFLVRSEDDERAFLQCYLGEEPTEYHHARFFLMSQLLHIFYFTVFMVIVSGAGETIDLNLFNTIDYRTFHDQMWAGEINLANNDARQQYAWVHLQQLLHNLQLKRFDESLKIISNHQKL